MTTRPMPACKPGDVVIVPFPFTDRRATKRRPALVCSAEPFNHSANHVVLAMITSATHSRWLGDTPIEDLSDAGLPAASVVRWKVFTLDASFILRQAGALSARDRRSCAGAHPIAI